METMNAALANWGPALLVCFTLVIGVIYNSSRISDLRADLRSALLDLRSYMDARFNAVDKRFDDSNRRIEDSKELLRSEIRRLEDRISPIHRP